VATRQQALVDAGGGAAKAAAAILALD